MLRKFLRKWLGIDVIEKQIELVDLQINDLDPWTADADCKCLRCRLARIEEALEL